MELRSDSPILFWIIFSVLGLILLALLAHIAYSFSLAFRKTESFKNEFKLEKQDEKLLRYGQLREKARQFAKTGQLKEATRTLLLSLLSLLEEKQVIHVAKSWTLREILQRLRARIDFGMDMREFQQAVEATTFGGLKIDYKDFLRLDGILDQTAKGISRVK